MARIEVCSAVRDAILEPQRASTVSGNMDQRTTKLATIGGGTAAFVAFVAWIVPNTTPVTKPSLLASMKASAQATRASYSPVDAGSVPVSLSPPSAQVLSAPIMRPIVARSSPSAPSNSADDAVAPSMSAPPPVVALAPAPPPAQAQPAEPVQVAVRSDDQQAAADYQAKRERWLASMGQADAGPASGDPQD